MLEWWLMRPSRAARMWVLLAGMGWVSSMAWAGKLVTDDGPPPDMLAVAEALEQANAGDRRGAIRSLNRVIQDYPGNVDAHVGRGVNHYMLGNTEAAGEDLSFAFQTEAWEQRETQTEGFTEVTTTITTLDLVDQRKTGAAMLVVMAVRSGDVPEGTRVATRARDTFGDHPQVLAATARLELAGGESKTAWTILESAMRPFDSTLFVQSVASEMVALDPENAPVSVTDWLKQAGQWTAYYNAAAGHLKTRQFEACVHEAAEGLVTFPDHPKMLAVGYPCAARADLQRAEQWLLASGGAKKAEPWSVIAHARSLRQYQRPDDALRLLQRMSRKLTGDLAAQRETLALDILLDGKRLDEALHWSTGHAPIAEANVGYALIQAERYTEALKLLTEVCPALNGTSGQVSCDQMLEYVKGSPGPRGG